MAKNKVQVSDNILFVNEEERPVAHLTPASHATAFSPASFTVVATHPDLTSEAVDKLESIKAGNRDDVVQKAKLILANPNSYEGHSSI